MYDIIARNGDTFATLARRAYGDDQKSPTLRMANPSLSEPLRAGDVVTVPQTPSNASPTLAGGESEIALAINGQRFKYWTSINIIRSMDSMDVLNVTAPFNPNDNAFKRAFKPLAFLPVGVTIGGEPLFTGTMLTATPETKPDGRTVVAACYATPAVMGDCTAPHTAYPTEWDGAKLSTIARSISAPFGVTVVSTADEGAVFERATLQTSETPLVFLTKLARQRGALVSSTPRGELLITNEAAGRPVASLREGESPLIGLTLTTNPQEYYSDITAIEPVVLGLAGGQYTVKNPFLKGVVRPYTFTANDTISADMRGACEAKLGRMYANVISYTATLATWRDPSGKLWEPNTTVEIDAPGAMVYTKYKFLVRAVSLTRSVDGGEVAELSLTTPGAFSSKAPEVLPWD